MIDINLSSFTNIIKPFFFNDLVAISFLGKNFKNLTKPLFTFFITFLSFVINID